MPKTRVHQIDPADGSQGDVATVSGTSVVFAAATYREVLMETGSTAPPVALESSDGGDWLYGKAG